MQRTTILLDAQTRRAARDLAQRYDCSTSEAIRRAVRDQRDAVTGAKGDRGRRTRALARLFVLFKGSDPEAEVRRLKSENAGF